MTIVEMNLIKKLDKFRFFLQKNDENIFKNKRRESNGTNK